MNSPILAVGGRLLLPVTLAFSLWLLLRGHNEPGGGFIGLLRHEPFLTHQWIIAPGGLALGTTLMFDCGVYLAVVGSVLAFLSPYLEE